MFGHLPPNPRASISKRISSLAAMSSKFDAAEADTLTDIQRKCLFQVSVGRNFEYSHFVVFECCKPYLCCSVHLRISAALKTSVEGLDKIHISLSDAYTAGVINGYSKESMPQCFEFGLKLFSLTLSNMLLSFL